MAGLSIGCATIVGLATDHARAFSQAAKPIVRNANADPPWAAQPEAPNCREPCLPLSGGQRDDVWAWQGCKMAALATVHPFSPIAAGQDPRGFQPPAESAAAWS